MYLYAGWSRIGDTAYGGLAFVDVARSDWFYDSVLYAFENKLMNGVSATEFAPDSTMSRAMIVTVLWRLENSPAPGVRNPFTDVPVGEWYTDAVRWAAEKGIVTGYSKTSFGPDDNITREQMVTILWRYAKYKGYSVSVLSSVSLKNVRDAGKISEYAGDAMLWAYGKGLIQGMGDNTLEPAGSATRAQAAAVFKRFLERVR